MSEKPELLVTAASPEEVEALFCAGADAVQIGNEQYALRVPGSFTLTQTRAAVEIAQRYRRKVYFSLNALMHQSALQDLEPYVQELAAMGIDAIIFGDPAVFVTARQIAPSLPLHWNSETTSTNYRTVNYWAKKGVARAVLARELSLEDVLEIKRKTSIEVQVQVHGMTCIFHSRRELVSNYLRYLQKEEGAPRGSLFVQESKRENEHYPILEDTHGTHMMSADDICMLLHLGPLVRAGVDAFKIEGLLKPLTYNITVVSLYRQAIDRLWDDLEADINPHWLEKIRQLQPKDRPLSTGFYFREQIY